MPRSARALATPGLRARCTELRELLAYPPDQPLATAQEIAAVWPGGARNPYKAQDGWVWCFAQLTRFSGRKEQRDQARTLDPAQLAAVVGAAAARQPVAVLLSIGERFVHHKAAWTLAWLDSLDAIMAPVAALSRELLALPAGSLGTLDDLRGFPALAPALAMRTWAWILLTEGVGLPFPSTGTIDPPEWTEQLLAEDYVAIFQAHRRIHFDAIAIMAAALPREDGERSRLSLGGFLAGYASEHGLPPSSVMRQWAFPEAVAAAVAAAESHRVSEANAKRRRDQERR